jgi:hypothetical protein
MKELALFSDDNGDSTTYTYGNDPNEPRTWDGDRIHGCYCDLGYTGYDCSKKTCPTGDDPATYDDHVEVQLLTCSAEAGYFTLTFRQQTTDRIYYNATAWEVREELVKLSTMSAGGVTWQQSSINSALAPYKDENGEFDDNDHHGIQVYYTLDGFIPYGVLQEQAPHKTRMDGDPFWETLNATDRNSTHHFCNTSSDATPNTIVIVFEGIHGDVPPITADASALTYQSSGQTLAGSINVYTDGASINGYNSITGTTEDDECNNRGLCNRETGKCECFKTFSSSDGKGNAGYLGDCGYRVNLGGFQNSFYSNRAAVAPHNIVN